MSQKEEDNAKIEREHVANRTIEQLTHLQSTPGFRLFMAECIEAEISRQDDIIHDRNRTAAERDEALAVWTALEGIKAWPERAINTARQAVED